MGLGLVFEVPMDALQSAQLSDVFWLLQFCFILLLDQVICVLSARLQPWPVCCLCEILGTNKEKPSSELAFAGINVRQSRRWLEWRGYSLRQPMDHKCIGRSVSFWHVFVLRYLKKKKKKLQDWFGPQLFAQDSMASISRPALMRQDQTGRFWLRCSICLSVCSPPGTWPAAGLRSGRGGVVGRGLN